MRARCDPPAQFLRFGAAEVADRIELRELLLGTRQIAAFDHQLAIIFGRAAMLRRGRERRAIIALGDVVAPELAVGEAEIGEDVGMRAEGALRRLERSRSPAS